MDSSEAKVESSPEILSPGGKSRYGRTRRPKIAHDFYNIDNVIIEDFSTKGIKSPQNKTQKIGQEILIEIQDEFTKLDDLGMKVASNFKTNPQRGLDDSIKERKFFKSAVEKMEDSPILDVTKVFKLISTNKSPGIDENCDKKNSPKTLKTYANRRKKHLETFESFGLPDEPIIPVKSPLTSPQRNAKIDIDLNGKVDINLPNPWNFNQFSHICVSDSVKNVMEEINEANFSENDFVNLLPDKFLSENREYNRLAANSASSQKHNTANNNNKKVTFTNNKDKVKLPIDENGIIDLTLDTSGENWDSNTSLNRSRRSSSKPKRISHLNNNNTSDLVIISSDDEEPTPRILRSSKNSLKLNNFIDTNSSKLNDVHTYERKEKQILHISQRNTLKNPKLLNNLNETDKRDSNLEFSQKKVSRKSSKFINLSQEMKEIEQKSPLKKKKRVTTAYKIKIEEPKIKIELIEFQVCDLVWAKLGSHPYWPCMIIEEPISGDYRKLMTHHSRLHYHVRFFGDKGRRSWVNVQQILPFYDKDDLDKIAKALKAENKLNASMIKESYTVRNTGKLEKWTMGVDEAMSLKNKTIQERSDYFFNLLTASREKKEKIKVPQVKEELLEEKIKTENKKRKRASIGDEPMKKIAKFNEESLGKNKLVKEKKVKNNLSSIEKSQQQIKKENVTLEARRRLRSFNQEKTVTSQINELAKKQRNESIDKKDELKDEQEGDTDSKFSDNSSVPTSLESQAALFRRNNIFRGIAREKVCQICEKSGDIFKCKGPCNGVYHLSCAQIKDVTENVEITSPKVSKNLISTPINFNSLSLAEKIDFRMKEIMKKSEIQMSCDSSDTSSEDLQDSRNKKIVTAHVTADDDVNYICLSDEKLTEISKNSMEKLKCHWCESVETLPCLVCNKEESKLGSKLRQKCSLHQCGKYYHPECLKLWPQTQWSLTQNVKEKKTEDTFVCPRHVCHTCISDDPRAPNSRCTADKVVKCLRCPATYHSSNYCVPAGSDILTTSQIVCPRHFTNHKSGKNRNFQVTINTNWCFICSKGGNLICCETCPTSVHAECLPVDLNEDETFYCEDCQSGRLPLYDEIVWVKLGTFRWWPALILFPNEVPDNVRNFPHNKGEFVVKFFGTYDHYWMGRGRAFLFQEGDRGHSSSVKKRMDNAFAKAIEEAEAAHQLKKQFKVNKAAAKNSILKPPPYIRIKVNKPVGNVRVFDGNTSNTTSCDCDPNEPHPCGPESDCLNRLLLTECNPDVCPAGDRCNNQCFEKRLYPPLVPHHTQDRGWGLKTLAPIRKGQFVIEYVGEMIDEQEYQRRIQKMHEQKEENYYFLTIDKDRMLDAGPKGNVARFMNHSCQPNCETQKWTVNGDTRVGLFASCDIPSDTELTFNYNLECIGKVKKICKCGAPSCSGFIGGKVKTEVTQKKPTKSKKKKSPPPILDIPVNNNPCFICGKLGDVGTCNNKICTKYYHLECLKMEVWPDGGKWVCPWHNCNICSKRTIRCCVKCINSFCPPHSEGNVRYDKLLGFVCSEHDPNKQLNEIEVTPLPKLSKIHNISTDEEAVTSTTEDVSTGREEDFAASLEGCITSTPMIPTDNVNDESTVSSASNSNIKTKRKMKRSKKKKVRNINKNLQLKNTAKLVINNCSTPLKYLRTTRSSLNRIDPDKDLPIRKRNRLRCATTL